ncbi:MAG: aminoglycoside phosphotransferase family protein [Candidatus Marsarchaeota archaeon]|nr:aminoglycoside phosphotransferase family protein [Candidatus Marsarchaeota archaeon]
MTGPGTVIEQKSEINKLLKGGAAAHETMLRFKAHFESLDPRIIKVNPSSPIRVKTMRRLGVGTRHVNYYMKANGKPFLIRFSLTNHPGEHVAYEYNGLETLKSLKIAPEPYYLEKSGKAIGLPFMIAEYIEGYIPERMYTSTIMSLAKLIANLHKINPDSIDGKRLRRKITRNELFSVVEQKVDYVVKKRNEYHLDKAINDALLDAYKRLESLHLDGEPKPVISHGDIAKTNIVMGDKWMKLIDWETIGLTDAAYDVAALFIRTKFTPFQRNLFLSTYLNIRKDETLPRRLLEYEKLRAFDRMCWCLWEAFDVREADNRELLPKWRSPALYMKRAKERFEMCKQMGLIPERVKWSVK